MTIGRIAALLVLQVLAWPAFAQGSADRKEWPHTDFGRITVEWNEILSGRCDGRNMKKTAD